MNNRTMAVKPMSPEQAKFISDLSTQVGKADANEIIAGILNLVPLSEASSSQAHKIIDALLDAKRNPKAADPVDDPSLNDEFEYVVKQGDDTLATFGDEDEATDYGSRMADADRDGEPVTIQRQLDPVVAMARVTREALTQATGEVVIEQKPDGTFKVMSVPAGVKLVVNKVNAQGDIVTTLRTEGPHRRDA